MLYSYESTSLNLLDVIATISILWISTRTLCFERLMLCFASHMLVFVLIRYPYVNARQPHLYCVLVNTRHLGDKVFKYVVLYSC